jgi:hypothetical protein
VTSLVPFTNVIFWIGYIAHMRDMRNAYNILVEKHKREVHLGDLGVDGRIILK